MRYFVTGATGFVGLAVVQKLRAQGDEVHALVRDPLKAGALQALGVKLHRGDVTDKASMRDPMKGADGIYHIAGWYKIGAHDKGAAQAVNVLGTRNVLELMHELQIPRGVYTSTCAVNSNTRGRLVDESYRFQGRHISEYDRTKAAAHSMAREWMKGGLPLIIVMPGLVYGPGDTSGLRASIVEFLQRRLPVLPDRTAYCWAHVEDTAQGHILAMEKGRPGQEYILAGEPRTLAEAYRLASQITGKPAPRVIPHRLLKPLAILARPFDSWLPPAYTSEGLRVVAGVTYLGDNTKARQELGYAPRPFQAGWEETLQHEMRLLERQP